MKRKITTIASFAAGATLMFGMLASVASAAVLNGSASINAGGVSANAQVKIDAAMTRTKDRGTQEIKRRVAALNDLSARIGEMKNISASDKANLQAQLQNQVNILTTLETQINSDSSTTTLKADVKSITDSYRIFVLVIPQGRIYATVDRITTIAADMTTIGAKLQARITAAQTAGKDVTGATTALADFNAKVSDAQTQAGAAMTEVSPLTPDQGDQAKLQANSTALKDARAKLKTAQADLVAARKDINTIRKDLPKVSASAGASASTTVSQ